MFERNQKVGFLAGFFPERGVPCCTPGTWAAPSAFGECNVSAIETEKLNTVMVLLLALIRQPGKWVFILLSVCFLIKAVWVVTGRGEARVDASLMYVHKQFGGL